MLRVITWNVRNGRGLDGRIDLGRIARLLRAQDADLIALQELDVGRERSDRVDQPARLAEALGMHATFFGTVDHGDDGTYGHALFTRAKPTRVYRHRLPMVPLREPRGTIEVRVETRVGWVRAFATHLGLLELERRWQIRPMLELIERGSGPTVLLGDLNAGPRQGTLRALRRRLNDAAAGSAAATWHAALPLRRLDYVLVSGELEPLESAVLGEGDARRASDHRPLVASLRRRER